MILSLKILCNINYSTCWFDSCCGKDWGLCSKRHDRRYENKRLTRKQADELLYRCVKKQSIIMAFIMYMGVRIFGSIFYKKAKRRDMTLEELEKEFSDNKHRQLKLDNILNDNLISIGKDVREVKHKQDKFTYILFGIVFIAGVMIGTQHTKWMPYLSNIVNVVKTANNIKGSNL